MITYVITKEDERLEKKAKENLNFLLEWWKSCYNNNNVTAAEAVWDMIVSILPIAMDFINHFGSGQKTDLFNALFTLHRDFLRKGTIELSLEMEQRFLKQVVVAGNGGEYTYQWLWESITPVYNEVRSSIEEGLLCELAGRENGYEKFFNNFLVLFFHNEVPARNLKTPRSFFFFIRKDIRLKYGLGNMSLDAKKVRSLVNTALKLYPSVY